MKKVLSVCALFASVGVMAQQPIISTKYTADPAPYVYGDTVYLYTTHDEDDAQNFKMFDWLLYTSTDMVNWQEHGAVASLDDFKWYDGKNGAWAEQVICRNGKWYMYCPIHGHGIGVLVSDSPYGPFVDPIGKPLVWQKEHWYDIDPTVMIDDDGQAYMYWGNPNVYCALLNEDMISLKSDAMQLYAKPEHYQEGPWVYKRNGHYYMAFASTCCPEGLGYAMSENPLGPWTFKGYIMAPTERTRGNHPGVIDYKGKSYAFGLNYDLLKIETMEHSERRSCGAFPIEYNADGTIVESPYFKDTKLEQVGSFNPFRKVEAEYMAWGYGLKTIKRGIGDIYVTNVNNGEYILLKGVNFAGGAKEVSASVAGLAGGTIEFRIDKADGKAIASLKVAKGADPVAFRELKAKVAKVSGVHDLYIVFKGVKDKELLNFDWWMMK